jgi:hypothetical protein
MTIWKKSSVHKGLICNRRVCSEMGAGSDKLKRKTRYWNMPLDKKSLKAHLIAQYAVQVDELLEQVEADQALHLTEIEDMALKLRREVGQDVTAALAVQEGGKQDVDVTCSECQQVMRYKGRKRKWLKTRSGDIEVERSYYYCEHCHRGHFPPR